MQKSFNQSAQFIKSFVRHTWFNSPMIYKASSIFDHAYPIIIKCLQGRRHVWKSGGTKYLVTQEDPSWLGPTCQGKFWKNDPPDWLNRPFPEQIFINVIEW